ncbi:MAG: hypothetical protein ABSC23_17735 [Bryobacteraceae bacterium]|jgi:hypothetical protein
MRYYFATLLLLASSCVSAQRKQGSPLDHLPKNIEILTYFGERADFSPDNQRIAFMAKSFGDALVIDLKTRIIRCLTCNVPGAAFLRIMHLPTGDYILMGPERFKDLFTSRRVEDELWFLSKEPGSQPVRLGQRMSEGIAISKRSLKIAYAETSNQNPDLPKGASRITTAELDLSGPRIIDRKVIRRSPDDSCTLEPQDFYDNDSKLTFSCFRPNNKASAMSIDLKTGQETDMSQSPGTYNEPDGIFPDGKYTTVLADRHAYELGSQVGSKQMDIYKLRLDGTGKDLQRLTYFNEYETYKASNSVVSTDGKYMAFQAARSLDEPGVGHGILLYRLP